LLLNIVYDPSKYLEPFGSVFSLWTMLGLLAVKYELSGVFRPFLRKLSTYMLFAEESLMFCDREFAIT
jgi:hypothetical protein